MHLANYRGYHYETNTGKKGGGICVSVHETLKYKIRTELSTSNTSNESLVLEIYNKKGKTF